MERDEYTPKLPDALSRALKAVTHLTCLSIEGNERHGGPFQGYLRSEMFRDCKFRLKTLHDKGYTFLNDEDLLSFLLQQSEIQDWRAGICAALPHPPGFPLDLLSQLSVAHVRYYLGQDISLLFLVASRRLRRLSLDMTNTLISKSTLHGIIKILSQCAQSLTHLRIYLELTCSELLESTDDYEPIDAIGLVAVHLPRLTYLGYSVQSNLLRVSGHLAKWCWFA